VTNVDVDDLCINYWRIERGKEYGQGNPLQFPTTSPFFSVPSHYINEQSNNRTKRFVMLSRCSTVPLCNEQGQNERGQ
jgi:hypothetical protein